MNFKYILHMSNNQISQCSHHKESTILRISSHITPSQNSLLGAHFPIAYVQDLIKKSSLLMTLGV